MAKVIITTQACPVCKYEYQENTYYGNKVTKSVRSKEENGKPLVDVGDILFVNSYYEARKELPEEFADKCFIVDVVQENAVLEKTVVANGDKPFQLVPYSLNSIPLEGPGYVKDERVLGMFCPKCGVMLNAKTCTKTEEKSL